MEKDVAELNQKNSEKLLPLRVGIDVGSTTVKIVILDEHDKMLYGDYERHVPGPLQVRSKPVARPLQVRHLSIVRRFRGFAVAFNSVHTGSCGFYNGGTPHYSAD